MRTSSADPSAPLTISRTAEPAARIATTPAPAAEHPAAAQHPAGHRGAFAAAVGAATDMLLVGAALALLQRRDR